MNSSTFKKVPTSDPATPTHHHFLEKFPCLNKTISLDFFGVHIITPDYTVLSKLDFSCH